MTGMAKYNPDEFFNRKPLTNADRIRAMSDEELAAWLGRDCPKGRFAREDETEHGCKDFSTCMACWLAWLQEATE